MSFENRYSTLDRVLHRIAFSTGSAQVGLSDLEDRLFKAELGEIEVQRPVFITAMPRAGTTLLLQMFVVLDEFASHSYRDMPFILAPILWSRFSSRFRQSDVPRERAHGDGMLVSVDSPEAFEEVVWKEFWRDHYTADRIIPWGDQDDEEFKSFLFNHIRKIILLRQKKAGTLPRYVSKNNFNIARLRVLRRNFSDSIVIVPFRDPMQHAMSLLRQHLNFLQIHARDHFARDYMAAIGHYDFGENFRPIDFDQRSSTAKFSDPTTLSFWVEYWISSYRHLIRNAADGEHFLSYESLCENAVEGLSKVADIAEVNDRQRFVTQASQLRQSTTRAVGVGDICATLREEAEDVHRQLMAVSIV